MKKIFRIRTILIAIIAVFSFMLLFSVNNIKVSAANDGYGECDNSEGAYLTDKGACKEEDWSGYGTVTITKDGMISVEYSKGITEILIYAEECAVWEYSKDGKAICKDNGGGESAEWNGKKYVIHGSGDYKQGSKTIHLYKYFEKNSLVKVSMIYQFMSSEHEELKKGSKNDSSSGPYNPLHCDLTISRNECAKYYNSSNSNIDKWTYNAIKWGKKSDYNLKTRIDLIKVGASSETKISYNNIQRLDQSGIVYEGGGLQKNFDGSDVKGVYVIVSNTMSDEAGDGFLDIVYDTVIPVLLIILGLAATVTIVVFGVQIIKGADDPQERSDKIKRLAGILIGIAIVFVVLAAIEPISELIQNMWEE